MKAQKRRTAVPGTGHARARANIALAKYWGKLDTKLNLPAVPSISMTLDRLVTDTRVTLDARLATDRVRLDGHTARGETARRAMELLDRVRRRAGSDVHARVESENRFPTASGLASSASGFAALAAAACQAYGVRAGDAELSRMARQSSASAARSIFGGFAELPAGTRGNDRLAARRLHDEAHWDVRLVVALTTHGKKAVGSTEGMERSRATSPLYDAWVERAPELAARVRRGLARRDLVLVGEAMEQSTMAFHACALSARPGILYFLPATIALLHEVRALRDRGIPVYATMDAGPHVKALCHARDASRVQRALRSVAGVTGTLLARPGRGVEVT